MTNWTITRHADATTKSISDWGIARPRLTRAAGGEDVLEFAIVQQSDDNPIFNHGSEVSLRRDGTIWFRGRITSNPRSAAPGGESISYRAEGLGWWLKNLTFTQEWAGRTRFDTVTTGYPSTGVTLNIDSSGAKQDTAQTIRDILANAIDQGAPFQIGTILSAGGLNAWASETRDQTIFAVLGQVLAWHPDAQIWVDYQTTPATIHVERRGDMATQTLAAYGPMIGGGTLTPRNDQVLAGVVLTYERAETGDVSGDIETRRVVAIDSAGVTTGPGVLRSTVALSPGAAGASSSGGGGTLTPQVQQIVAEPWDITDEDWWVDHSELLTKAGAEHLAIGQEEITMVTPPVVAAPVNPNAQLLIPPAGPGQLPNELMLGQPNELMRVKWAKLRATALVAYNGDDPDVLELFSDWAVIDGEVYPAIRMAIEFVGTDAVTRVYKYSWEWQPPETPAPGQSGSGDDAETPYQGIAAALYQSTQKLQWEGSWQWTAQECGEAGRTPYVGKTLNLSGGRAEWKTMGAMVQSVTYDIQNGTSSANVRPPGVLSIQDYTELLRGLKRNPAAPPIANQPRNDAQWTIPNTEAPPQVGGEASPTRDVLAVKSKVGPAGFQLTRALSGQWLLWPAPVTERLATSAIITRHDPTFEDEPWTGPKILSAGATYSLQIDTDGYGVLTGAKVTATPDDAQESVIPEDPDDPEDIGTPGVYLSELAIIDALGELEEHERPAGAGFSWASVKKGWNGRVVWEDCAGKDQIVLRFIDGVLTAAKGIEDPDNASVLMATLGDCSDTYSPAPGATVGGLD